MSPISATASIVGRSETLIRYGIKPRRIPRRHSTKEQPQQQAAAAGAGDA